MRVWIPLVPMLSDFLLVPGSPVACISPTTTDDTSLYSHCGKISHLKDRCFQLHGYPAREGGRGLYSRGGRGGLVFAGNISGGRGSTSSHISNTDRRSTPTLTDEQWQQLMSALKRMHVSTSTKNLASMYGSDD